MQSVPLKNSDTRQFPDLFSSTTIVSAGPEVLPLRKLADEVKLGLRKHHPGSYWVEGEITDFKYSFVKNYYSFRLVDKDSNTGSIVAGFPATIWSQDTILVDKFQKTTGYQFGNTLKIQCQCRVSFHAVYGISLQVTDINPEYSIGNIELARQQVLSLLLTKVKGVYLKDGEYLTPNKSLELSPILKRVALITATGSQGHQDFVHELNNGRNGYKYVLTTYPANVGKDGASKITAILKNVIHSRSCDVIVIARAGGNSIDLLAFDDFALNKEIATSPIPIISGIGHEQNKSISDLMATVTVKTPTKAAAFIEEHNLTNATRLNRLLPEVARHVNGLLSQENNRLNTLHHRITTHVNKLIDGQLNKLNELVSAVRIHGVNLFYKAQHDLLEMQRVVELKDPRPALQKGMALVHNKNGELVTTPDQVKPGDQLDISIKEGIINVTVNNTKINSPWIVK